MQVLQVCGVASGAIDLCVNNESDNDTGLACAYCCEKLINCQFV